MVYCGRGDYDVLVMMLLVVIIFSVEYGSSGNDGGKVDGAGCNNDIVAVLTFTVLVSLLHVRLGPPANR
jgi:hypothetical protein